MDPKQLVFIGFGAVARSLVTIMLNIKTCVNRLPILIIDPKKLDHSETYIMLCQYARKNNLSIQHVCVKLTKENYIDIFGKYVKNNAIVIELAYRVNTLAIILECRKRQCVYVNTAIDEWMHTSTSLFSLKKKILAGVASDNGPNMTTVVNHGMNPGLVTHLVKFLLKILSKKSSNDKLMQLCKNGKYNHVAKELGLTLIQIAERDNQITHLTSNENAFYNTWSVIGLLDESTLRAEVSWGTHEKKIPTDADVSALDDSCQIRLPLLGNQLRTRSFEPEGGKLTGYCIPHAECYSLANFLQVKDTSRNISIYRPSVYYSYLIPDTAKLITHYIEYCLDDNGFPKKEHVLRSDEIQSGFDSVGCLAFFNNGKRYWIGSTIYNDFAKKYSPEINVTCMQVGISVLACVEWMLLNPNKGLLEPEDIDTAFILSYCKEWLGKLYCADVTDKCGLKSDQFSDLVIFPNNVVFK